jgi:hypothetical protein
MERNETVTESIEDAKARYIRAAQAMQSGVAMMMNINPKQTTGKHLRVGINSSMVDHAGLVALLIEKGIITDEEYLSKIADAMEREVTLYEAELALHIGAEITLG